MLYSIYKVYITGVTVYKLYEYLEIAKLTYFTCNYTYITINQVYKFVKNYSEQIELDSVITDWDMCDEVKKLR